MNYLIEVLLKFTILLVFLATAFATNVIHLILLISVKPFNKRIYFQLVQFNNWTFMAQSVFLYQYWSSSELIFYCKQSDYDALKHKKAFIIANHSDPVNILLMMVTLNHFNRLGNDISYGMTCFKFIPFIGWHIYLAGHILLQKSFTNDKKLIEKRLMEVKDNPNNVWIVLLPEGDQFTIANFSKSVRYALKMRKQPLMHHLTPRHKAFAVTYKELKKLEGYSIVNAHIAYERSPKFSNLLQQKKIQARIYFQCFEFNEIESNFDGIYKLFQQQDELREKFLKFGSFNENGKLKDFKEIKIEKDQRVLVNFLVWAIFWLFFAMRVIIRKFERLNCYFEDERELKFFKVYTKANCQSESMSEFMIKQCGCVEFFMIRNKTTRICLASEKSCYNNARNEFTNQINKCECLDRCNYVKYNLETEIRDIPIRDQNKSTKISRNLVSHRLKHISTSGSAYNLTFLRQQSMIDWFQQQYATWNDEFQVNFTEIRADFEITRTDENLKALTSIERDCYFEKEKKLKYFKLYTQENCVMECIFEYLIDKCKCIHPNHIYGPKHASIEFCQWREVDCIQLEQDRYFQKYGKLLEENCTCLSTCDSLIYHIRKYPTNDENNLIVINVYKNTDQLILYRRFQLFTFSDTVSYVGGLLGLFAGISMFSIIEIFYFFTVRVFFDMIRLIRNQIIKKICLN
ncbi:hypothetical protein PVAND_001317 [Polypedilum vanderplanki]|uniref:Phospholipid/glycerol acyltransferase domain-containing protein n=1 Tax=Polypedilum vanderplanki TaxID=319348 RepID=A0A9J6BN39_POLVA|nr:hypothetical protein PVAND_001317 [Polypedilum vanderplanki]